MLVWKMAKAHEEERGLDGDSNDEGEWDELLRSAANRHLSSPTRNAGELVQRTSGLESWIRVRSFRGERCLAKGSKRVGKEEMCRIPRKRVNPPSSHAPAPTPYPALPRLQFTCATPRHNRLYSGPSLRQPCDFVLLPNRLSPTVTDGQLPSNFPIRQWRSFA